MNRLGQLAVVIGGVSVAFLMHWNFQQLDADLQFIFEQQAGADITAAKKSFNQKLDSIESDLGEIVVLLDDSHLGKGFHGTEREFSLIASNDELYDAVHALTGNLKLHDLLLTHHATQEHHYSLLSREKAEPDVLHLQRHYEWIDENIELSRIDEAHRAAIISNVADSDERQIYYSLPLLDRTRSRAVMMITLVLDLQEVVSGFQGGQYLEIDGDAYHFREGFGDAVLLVVESALDKKEYITDLGMRRLWGEWAVGIRGDETNPVIQARNELKSTAFMEFTVVFGVVLLALVAIEAGIRNRRPLMDENNRLSGVIDEREEEVQAAKENNRVISNDLLNSELRLHSVIDASIDGIVVCDSEGKIQSVNHALKNMLGYSDDHDLIGNNIEFIFPELDGTEYKASTTMVDSTKPNCELASVEANALTKENQFMSVELVINRVKIGQHEALSIIVHDISERIKDKDEIRDVQKILRTIIDNVAEGIITSDSRGVIRTFNQAAEEMFGWKSEEVIGKSITLLVTGDDKERHDNYLRKYFDIGKSNVLGAGPREVIGAKRDGGVFHMEIATSEMMLNNERVFIAIVRDITERKVVEKNMHASYSELESMVDSHTEDLKEMNRELVKARDEALVASRSKSGFLAMMSHEIRTPINGVLGMLSLVRETELNSIQRDYIETAYASGESLLELLNDVLDLSKIDAGRMYMESSKLDLYQVVEKCVYIVSRSRQKRDVEVTCFISHDVPRFVKGDASRLRQVITNLTSNAVKFTSQGEVAICLTRGNSESGGKISLHFEVKDTGIGIENVDIERIFEEFSQADNSDRRNYGGSGLGLAICKRIVSLMGGDITVESEAGVGSTFAFTVNVDPLPGESDRVLKPEKCNLVVISDNETRRAALEKQLKSWGEKVALLNPGEILSDAISMVSKGSIFIVDIGVKYCNDIKLMNTIENLISEAKAALIVSESCAIKAFDAEKYDGKLLTISAPILPSDLYEKINEICIGARKGIASKPPSIRSDITAEELNDVSVLIAEDNRVNQKVISAMLRKIGVNVTIVENGKEVLDLLVKDNRYFDLVLMDCQMPEMDGYTAARSLRKHEKIEGVKTRIPIIAMTAHALPGDREKCLDAGMDDYITKPIKIEVVKEAIKRWIDERSLSDSPVT